MSNLLHNSIKWCFGKKDYSRLLREQRKSFQDVCAAVDAAAPTYEHCCERRAIDTTMPLLIAQNLPTRSKNALQRLLLSKRSQILNALHACSGRLADVNLPAQNKRVRLEFLCELLAVSSGFSATGADYARYKAYCMRRLQLEECEKRLFDVVYELTKCKAYCALFQEKECRHTIALACEILKYSPPYQCNQTKNEYTSLCSDELRGELYACGNACYTFRGEEVFLATACEQEKGVAFSVYENGKLLHKAYEAHGFYENYALFSNKTAGLMLNCAVHNEKNSEIRNLTIENSYRKKRKLTLALTALLTKNCFEKFSVLKIEGRIYLQRQNEASQKEIDSIQRQLLICFPDEYEVKQMVQTEGGCFVELNKIIEIPPRGKVNLDEILIFSADLTQLCAAIRGFNVLNAHKHYALHASAVTALPLEQKPSVPTRFKAVTPPLTPFAYDNVKLCGENNNFLYDEKGNNATLLRGYLTIQGGEQVYLLYAQKAIRITAYFLRADEKSVHYLYRDEKLTAHLRINFEKQKSYVLTVKTTLKLTLTALLALDFASPIELKYDDGIFSCTDFTLSSTPSIAHFTRSASNFDRTRVSLLSDNLNATSSFLAATCPLISDGTRHRATFCLSPEALQYRFEPLYSHNKSAEEMNVLIKQLVFLYANKLLPLDALTLSACAYVSPDFVKQYLVELATNGYESAPYYDSFGKLCVSTDNYAYALTLLTYTLLTGDNTLYATEDNKKYLLKVLERDESNAVLLLILEKAARITISNGNLLLKVEQITKNLNEQQRGIGKLIGAIPPCRDEQEHSLHQLAQQHPQIHACRRYITLFESYYGAQLKYPYLNVRPLKGCTPERFSVKGGKTMLNLHYKRGNPSLKLNDLICLSYVDLSCLNNAENSLIVTY